MALIQEPRASSVPFGSLFGDEIEGTEGDDILVGTFFGDDISGLGGDDLILADPTVFDFLGGNDFVDGGSGDDVIFTFGGRDEVIGGDGNDTVQTADGRDRIFAGSDNDNVQSGRGEDRVYGGDGEDELRGGEDDDILYGDAGNDRVIGGSDNDTLIDGTGNDELEGRTGNDTLILTDDGSTDRVVFMAGDVGNGVDTIRGFNTAARDNGGDLIDIQDLGLSFQLAQDSADVLVLVGPAQEELARVEGVTVEALADNVDTGAGAALIADAAEGELIPLGTDGGPVPGLVEVLDDDDDDDDDETTKADGQLNLAQMLDDGAVL